MIPALALVCSSLGLPQDPAPVPVAVMRSGLRVQCEPEVKVGANTVATPFGRFRNDAVPTDAVVEVADAAKELEHLQVLREADYAAWLARLSERGLLAELATAAAAAAGTPELEDDAASYEALRHWGGQLDPIPLKLESDQRVDWLWAELAKADPARAALLTGRLLAEVPGPHAMPNQRLGLVDLRRGLKCENLGVRRAAAALAARQGERDLLLPLIEGSLRDADGGARAACALAASHVDENQALGRWTVALWRAKEAEERVQAAEHLGNFGNANTVPALVYALAASNARPAGGYIYLGRQIAIVGDVDVEVAQAAAIADPVVTVIQEGTVLEERPISTSITRTVMRSLGRLTGANPGPNEADWLRWYEEQEKARK